MGKYRVVSIKTIGEEEIIEASDFDEAKAKWEEMGIDGDLYFIEDEHGMTIYYG